MVIQIQLRRDTSTNWMSYNPTLAEGELGLETDTHKMKLGNGASGWVALPYVAMAGDFLKLDCSNDPLTGDLHTIADILAAQSSSYTLINSCFSYGGHDYVAGGVTGFDGAIWCTGNNLEPMEFPGVDYSRITGVNNIQVGLYNLGPDAIFVTVYYLVGDESLIAAMFDGFVGPGNWSVVVGTDILVPTDGIYAFTGYPSGWTLAPSYPEPAANMVIAYTTKIQSDGRLFIGKDMWTGRDTASVGNIFVGGGRLTMFANPYTMWNANPPQWNSSGHGTNEFYATNNSGGSLNIYECHYLYGDDVEWQQGSAGSLANHQWDLADNDSLGFKTVYIRDDSGNPATSGAVIQAAVYASLFPGQTDYMLQAFKSIQNPTGGVPAVAIGLQDSSTEDVNVQLWALNMGLSLYGDCNYNWTAYGLQSSYRVDIGGHTLARAVCNSSNITLTGGSHASSLSTVGESILYEASLTYQNCDPDSTFESVFMFKDSTNLDGSFKVTNYYGLYIPDHTAHVDNECWGIWNASPTYLGGPVTYGGNLNLTGLLKQTNNATDPTGVDDYNFSNYNITFDENSAAQINGMSFTTVVDHSTYDITNITALSCNVVASSGSGTINGLQAVKIYPGVSDSYAGTITRIEGFKVIPFINSGPATINELCEFSANAEFIYRELNGRIVGFHVEDLDINNVQDTNPTYGVLIDPQTASNAWGVHSAVQSYFGGLIIRTDGTLQPIQIADADAENDSVYYSTDRDVLCYKDSGGTVNALY